MYSKKGRDVHSNLEGWHDLFNTARQSVFESGRDEAQHGLGASGVDVDLDRFVDPNSVVPVAQKKMLIQPLLVETSQAQQDVPTNRDGATSAHRAELAQPRYMRRPTKRSTRLLAVHIALAGLSA